MTDLPEVPSQQAEPTPNTPESPTYVTREQFRHALTFLAQQAQAAQPSPQEPQVEQPANNDELQALKTQLAGFQAQQQRQQIQGELSQACQRAGIEPDAVEYLMQTWSDKLQVGESGVFLKGGIPLTDALNDFKASKLGQRFRADNVVAPVAAPVAAKATGQDKPKTTAGELLMKAFGR